MKVAYMKRIMNFIFKVLKTIFIQPFIWYGSLSWPKKILVGFLTVFTGCLLIASLPVLLFYSVSTGMFGHMPDDNELMAIKNYQASEVYSADSVLLGRYFVQNRSDATYKEVSHYVFDAIIATEDARFYEHTGVDTRSLLRVLFKSILLRQQAGGGSTITQQLAKNLFGRKQYGWLTMPVNKIREAIIANQLEKLYSKNEIILLYVNTVSFGEDTYGIKTATQRFFNIAPSALAPEQAAVLAGMLKSPTNYNPRTRPANAFTRRNVVLEQMEKYKYLSVAESAQLQKKPLVLNYKRMDNSEGLAPYFRERLKTDLLELLSTRKKPDGSAYDLYTDGLKIYTTIHSRLQQYAEEAAVEHLKRIQPLLTRQLARTKFFDSNKKLLAAEMKKTNRYKALEAQGLSSKEIMTQVQKKDSLRINTLWGEQVKYLSPMDSLQQVLSSLQTGMLVVNPHTGAIMAWVGGANFKQVQYDHILSQRQVGSVFKPIVYAEGLVSGMKPCDFISNKQITYTQYEDWKPENSGEKENDQYSMAGALANSINTISVQICMQAGIKQVISLARTLGIQSDLPAKPSIALGVADISLLELTGAYTAFANNGVKSGLQSITSVLNASGEKIYQSKNVYKKCLSPEQAHTLTNMLCNVVDKGTAYELRDVYGFRGQIAGKTGTTQDNKDGWFMGYTNGFLAGVWVGADNPAIHFTSMAQGRGASTAMPIWAGFYKRVQKDPALKYLVTKDFPFENDIACEMYKEDTFMQKIFQRKHKKNNSTGLEDTPKERTKKKKDRKRHLP